MPAKALSYVLTPGEVNLATLKAIYGGNVTLAIDEPSRSAVERAFNTVSTIIKTDTVTYGINTGFGKLATTIIPLNRLAELQRNLILSHSVGLGDLLPDDVVRLVMACKIISLARGQSGQIAVAEAVYAILTGSEIIESHAKCSRVQDPYSVRCIPQVMGACLDNLKHAAQILKIEANAASDNPLIFSDDQEIISGGNFHAEPVAFAADIIALAVAEIGAISERRLALLLDSGLSGLPPFLVNDGGVNSGFMIAQVTAAALASENKSLAHPASVDSLPTSANQEDHVSMATYAARRLGSMCFNTAAIVGIEAMAAAQGIEFHRPLRSSSPIEQQLDQIRQHVPWLDQDRLLAPDIDYMRSWATGENWPEPVTTILPCYTLSREIRGE